MRILTIIITIFLGSNINSNFSSLDPNLTNQERKEIKRKTFERKTFERETFVRERTNRDNIQNMKVPRGYRFKGNGTYVYGKWFISYGGGYNAGSYPNWRQECKVKSYGLENYKRSSFSDFSQRFANQTIIFNIYFTTDGDGHFAVTKVKGACVTIGVYQSGRYALSNSFNYQKHITDIYEYLYLNN